MKQTGPERRSLMPRDARDRMIVALDLPDVASALRIVGRLDDAVSFYKIGMELVFAGGLSLIPQLRAANKRVFLDMKLLDIDNTVAAAVRNIGSLDVNLTTVHAYPGAMRAAATARGGSALGLLGVTVLTSMDNSDLVAAGYRSPAAQLVSARAADAAAAGMDGIVCSVAEAAGMRSVIDPRMVVVTPGIRPAGDAVGDQKRVATPGDAIRQGADYCVVGRPVTKAVDPVAAANAIAEEIDRAT